MADIKDDIGRIGKFQDAAIEKLSSMLTSAVGKAVKYAADQAKSFVSDKDYKDLQKALEDLGDDLKENLNSTRKKTLNPVLNSLVPYEHNTSVFERIC